MVLGVFSCLRDYVLLLAKCKYVSFSPEEMTDDETGSVKCPDAEKPAKQRKPRIRFLENRCWAASFA